MTEFDESAYLNANPDIASAVAAGQFKSGREHYEKFGHKEARSFSPSASVGSIPAKQEKKLSRSEKILSCVSKNGLGLEIGPSHSPVAPKCAGYNVKILDHLPASGLRSKYAGHPRVNIELIEDVDYIWRGESFLQLVGDTRFDWIIASHVIEHTPDLVGFLNDCASILKDDGVLSLAVPDKRYCFDHFREVSSLGKVIDAHFSQAKTHSPGTTAEFFLNVVRKGGSIAWSDGFAGSYEFLHSLQQVKSWMDKVNGEEDYVDLHAWCFTPSTFRLAVEDLFSLSLIRLREAVFFDTFGHEFFITLSRRGKGPEKARLELLEAKEKELRSA